MVADLPEVTRSESPSPTSDLPRKVDRPSLPDKLRPSPSQDVAAHDPDARAALSLVGVDPSAEIYWANAINNPNLSGKERQDLIEDLNEDGLPDPKHLTTEDLFVVVRRLELIEMLAPSAMDQVNADAFAEAYKDLSQMLAVSE